MTKQKLGSSARKTITKWKQSRPQTVTLATGVVESTSSVMEKSRSLGLKDSDSPLRLQMIGDKVLVEEEPLEHTIDDASGLTESVVSSIKSGLIVLSDESKYAVMKYPFKGTVLSVGERVFSIKVGDRIHFAPLGVQRFRFNGKQYLVMHKDDVHGKYAPIT